MMQEKEENLLKNRFMELACVAERRGIPFYTDFLNLNEQSILYSMEKQLKFVTIHGFGGYELAERKIYGFLGRDSYYAYSFEAEEEQEVLPFPLSVIKITVKNEKFSDKLTHRDYLGAILNLGIDRSKIGDILVDFPNAFVFCKEEIGEYIADNLAKIKHTQVDCCITERQNFHYEPKYEEIRKSISSIRLDAIIAAAFGGSRSSLSSLITGEKVYVNGKLVCSNSYVLKEGDIVSVRGYGKFRFQEIQSQTKKGRTYVLLQKYI